MFFYIIIFLVCCAAFYFAGKLTVDGLARMARYFGLREFTVAFFSMAFASSLPNFIVGISAALRGIPEFSFGDVSGNNLAAMTIVVAIAAFFTKKGIPAASKTVFNTAFFVMASALLPLVLIYDGSLSRTDGIILIGLFVAYVAWLFSKKERFVKSYEEDKKDKKLSPGQKFWLFVKDFSKIVLAMVIFIAAAQGMVMAAQFFAASFGMSIILIGILITGAGSSLPEIYFDSISARKGETWMILGDIMGAIIIPSTLVLGTVVLIAPIHIVDLSSLALARIFIIFSAIMFPVLVRSGRRITKNEAVFLLALYVAFLIIEIFVK